MYVIQSGIVEVVHKMEKSGEQFVIEKLYRGSIINHNSFLMSDGIDTDAVCRTTVTIYYIEIDIIKALRAKHIELENALTATEVILLAPGAKEPALDYIIRDPYSKTMFWENKYKPKEYMKNAAGEMVHNYAAEEHRRKLTVKLKNAIMVHWLEVK